MDDLLYVAQYPPADAKVEVLRRERQCGGLVATALVAAARQGARCAYGGALGADEHSAFVLAAMRAEGIDVSVSPRHPQAAPIHSTIVVDQLAHTRNIFFHRPVVVGPLPDAPTAGQVRSARVLMVDHYGGAATVRALDLARSAGVAVVADLEREDAPAFAEILARCDHLIVSEKFAARVSGLPRPEDAAVALLGPGREAVVVTCGAAGCWVVSAGESQARHFPAFEVETVDTTGCGDTFHGVYAAELARGTGPAERRSGPPRQPPSRRAGAVHRRASPPGRRWTNS